MAVGLGRDAAVALPAGEDLRRGWRHFQREIDGCATYQWVIRRLVSENPSNSRIGR